jgi:hypothetical protein
MPLVRVELERSLLAKRAEISEEIQQAFVDALGVPENDRFQVFQAHDEGELVGDPSFNGVDRRSLLVLQVTMVHMYSPERKRALFEELARRLEKVGIRHEDLLVCVAENGFEDWYAGR